MKNQYLEVEYTQLKPLILTLSFNMDLNRICSNTQQLIEYRYARI